MLARTPRATIVRMTEDRSTRPALPDRLSADPKSPHHVAAVFEHEVGIRFNGSERNDVEEYCISEGWVRMAAGRSLDRRGQPMTMKFKGTVEAWFLDSVASDETPAD